MHKRKFFLLGVLLSLVVVSADAARERSLHVQNSVRVGFDDNIYQKKSGEETASGFVTDIINLSGKFTFSSRTDVQVYWQPELRFRVRRIDRDGDDELLIYQTLYGRLNHAISQRLFLTVSDRFYYQDKEDQVGDGVSQSNQQFVDNNLLGALDITVNNLSQVKLGAGYRSNVWDDKEYGGGKNNNDYGQFTVNGSYIRELRPNKTHGVVGLNYVDLKYDGDRGGYEAWTTFIGADQIFSPSANGNVRVGYSMTSIDTELDKNASSSPYVQAGLGFNPTARTSLNGTLGYSIDRGNNSFWNSQDRFTMSVGGKYDLTGKISISASVSYTSSSYDGDNRTENIEKNGEELDDAVDKLLRWSLRGSYQINRNNFIDAGYAYTLRTTDAPDFITEYNRNRIDIGWRLRL